MNIISTADFESQIRKLIKQYRQVDRDVRNLAESLLDGPRPQDRKLPNIGARDVYKARIPNTSARIGTRGGFRVIYRVKDETILLLLIWAKTQTADLPDSEIRRVASKYDAF